MTNRVSWDLFLMILAVHLQAVCLNLSHISGPLHELDTVISSLQNVVLSLPRSNHLRARCVQRLAKTRLKRYTLSGQQDDLEQSILGFTEAIYLPPSRDNTYFYGRNIFLIFYLLTLAILLRAMKSRQPEDVKFCVICLRYLH